jgi:predicted transcriptional regulator
MSQTLLAMAKDLVMAPIAAHRLAPEEMHQALQHTYASRRALKTQEDAHDRVAVLTPKTPPPISWKKSITKHAVTCLEWGPVLSNCR